MIQANVHDAKTRLSQLISRAEAGEEVVIARNGKPAVRLSPVSASTGLATRDIVGCMRDDVGLTSDAARRELGAELAAEMRDTAKFDVELGDELEFIPAAAP